MKDTDKCTDKGTDTDTSIEKDEIIIENPENNISVTFKKKSEEEEDNENEKDLTVGLFAEAPGFMQDNEYIQGGYLLNYTSIKKTLKSLFMWHNETINIWSHLLGALFFFFLIFFTSIFITNYKSQLDIIRKDLLLVKEEAEFLYKENTTKMDNIYSSINSIKYDFDILEKKTIYEESLRKIFSIINEIKNITSKVFYYISLSFRDDLSSLKEEIYSLKEEILDLIKLDNYKSEKLEENLDKEFDLNLEKRNIKELARWPLFIIIHSAILCFLFSACFHSIGTLNEKLHDILNRFDYGGISILISGSCFPPYYYFFYYSKTFRYFYLILISVFGLGTFLYSLTDDFNKPKRRTLRGVIFLIFGLCTGIPILHMAFFGDSIDGYDPGIKLYNWYFGGICYVTGAILYIIRFPEKLYPGKFDYIGASHQIFHILVFLGALFHFFGSVDAYDYRFLNLKKD